MNLKNLCKARILKKIRGGEYMYNPYIFYYGDDNIAKAMRNKFICDFNDTIKIKYIKIYKFLILYYLNLLLLNMNFLCLLLTLTLMDFVATNIKKPFLIGFFKKEYYKFYL